MVIALKCPEELKNTELGLTKEVKAKERGLILPAERRQLKLWARMNLSKKAGREEKANKDGALGRVARRANV